MTKAEIMQKKLFNKFLMVPLALGVVGCEAPLNLEGVEQELKKPFHRYDQLQAAASNEQKKVIVGASGTVLSSADSGQTWQRTELDGRPSLIDIASCPDGSFIALSIDRKLWVSDAEAMQWQQKNIETMEEVLAVECNDNGYWVTGSFSTVLSSSDGGDSWNENSLGEDAQLTTIQFLDSNNGFATGEFGIVLKTTDAGATWESMEYLPNEFYPQSSYFSDLNMGWVVGLSGAIVHTNDGGQSWQAQESGTEAPLYGVDGDGETIIAVGENGALLSYQQGQWQPVKGQQQVRAYLRAIDVQHGTVVSAGGGGAIVTFAQ